MKKSRVSTNIRNALVYVLIAALAIISMPFTLLATRHNSNAKAEVTVSAAIPDVTLTVNYYRLASDWTGYNMWLWPQGGDGRSVQFDAETVTIKNKQWKTVTTTISNINTADNGNAIGVIVRKSTADNDWAEQTKDMFITSDKIVNNAVTIYLIQGDDSIYYSEDDVNLANRLTRAAFNSMNSVYFSTSKAIAETSRFNLYEGDIVVGSLIAADNPQIVGKQTGVIDFATGEIDLTKTYTIKDEPTDAEFDEDVHFAPRAVSKADIFEYSQFNEKYVPDANEVLGVDVTAEKTTFKVWSPFASAMKLNVYDNGTTETKLYEVDMNKADKGMWTYTFGIAKSVDKAITPYGLCGKYYTYTATVYGKAQSVVDPYARSGNANGTRGMILNLDETNPTGWANQSNPTLNSYSEAIIYEAQLRDLTIDSSSGVSEANRGKFLGLTESSATNGGTKTAVDYIKELGITQLHFQPIFDFASVNENFTTATFDGEGQYNWGYDPLNYNMPEGSYSSDPADGAKRVTEMKQMVMALHNAGIQVIMDVVYNHVSSAESSNFQALCPDYYFRLTADGSYSNGSGCGNETASERAMFRRFMIDSVKYWSEEYKIDGFRFDLMGLHDIVTMNELYDELATINPDVMIYGEGWTGGTTPLATAKAALKANAKQMPNIAVFNDDIRDGLKGSVFGITGKGYVQGVLSSENAVYFGAYGGAKAFGGINAFTAAPTQSINYVSAHDNSTLWDKLNASIDADKATLKAMNRMAATASMTSAGPAFFLAGEEMLRSKPTTATNNFDNRPEVYMTNPEYYFSDNSYKSNDSVNAIRWNLATENADMVDYYKGLISIRKAQPFFKMTTAAEVRSNVYVNDENLSDGIAMYAIKSGEKAAILMFNATESTQKITVPQGDYKVLAAAGKASNDGVATFSGSQYSIGAHDSVIMVIDSISADALENWAPTVKSVDGDKDNKLGLKLGLGIGIPAVVLVSGGVVFFLLYNKKKKEQDDSADKSDEKEQKDKAVTEPDTQSDAPEVEATAEEENKDDVKKETDDE